MAVTRVKEWSAGEVLTAADLNAEFDNVLDNGESLAWPATGSKDFNGQELILDADQDTSITADTDDRVDFRIAGSDCAHFGHASGNTGAFFLFDTKAFSSTASTDIGRLRIGNTNALTVPTGTTSVAAALFVEEPNLTATGTITSAATLYIEAAPTEGSSNYALWVDDGAAQFDSTVDIDGVLTIASDIVHAGDTNNKIAFTTDAQSFETGGTSRLDLSDSGMRLGAANARVTTILDEDDLSSDSATALATQQSVKAYVDGLTGVGDHITLASEQASTSGTSITFSSIPAGVKRITVMFDGVSTDGTSGYLVQIGDSGGVETSGYFSLAGDSTGQDAYTAGFGLTRTLANAGDVLYGAVILSLEDSSNFTWCATGVVAIDASNDRAASSAGRKALSAELDRVVVTTASGDTFDAGAISISYE